MKYELNRRNSSLAVKVKLFKKFSIGVFAILQADMKRLRCVMSITCKMSLSSMNEIIAANINRRTQKYLKYCCLSSSLSPFDLTPAYNDPILAINLSLLSSYVLFFKYELHIKMKAANAPRVRIELAMFQKLNSFLTA